MWAAYIRGGGASSLPLAASLVFALLIFAGDRIELQMRGAVWQSLGTTSQIAALLVLPAPIPLLVCVLATTLNQALYVDLALHKRVFNIVHPSLALGLAGMACALLVPPDHALAGGMQDTGAAAFLADVGDILQPQQLVFIVE